LQTLRIRKRFDHVAAVDDAALLDPAIKTRTIVQRQINRQAEKSFEILAWEIEPPAKENGLANPKALSDEMMQGYAADGEVATVVGWPELDGTGLKWRIVSRKCLQYLHLE
jgi:hypothetical protein